MKKYNITSGVKMNKENPDTFWIPTQEERTNLPKGSSVKLIFTEDIHGERMWVTITETIGEKYKGLLDSSPAFIECVEYGDEIIFDRDDIISIWDQ